MQKSKKRTIAIIAAVLAVIVLAVILLLFVFNDKGGDAPDTSPTPGATDTTPGTTPDNSTPPPSGETTTPDITTPDPGTSEPTETPGESDPPDTSEPTLKHPIDDPNVPASSDSAYAVAKAEIDKWLGYFETDHNIDINKIIEEAYTKYGDLIDRNVINPAFVRVLIIITNGRQAYNTFGLSDASWDFVNSLLSANGFEPLALSRTGTKYSLEAGMIFLSAFAHEKGYVSDDLDELYCDYQTSNNRSANVADWDYHLEQFNKNYYPWLSKDPGSGEQGIPHDPIFH